MPAAGDARHGHRAAFDAALPARARSVYVRRFEIRSGVSAAIGLVNKARGPFTTPDLKLLGKAETNLLFAIDRVVQFITRYSDFVNQGNEYYKKFAKIADSYENEKACSTVLPDQFKQLKNDIDETLDKFNSAYKMPEVQGSKLKDMLYGTCLLYTSDAADERSSVDLGGRRIIKNKKYAQQQQTEK